MPRILEQVATMIEQMHILIDIITSSNVFPLHLHYLEHVSIHYSITIIHSRATRKRLAYFNIYIYMPSFPLIYMHTWKALISTGNKQLVNVCPLKKKVRSLSYNSYDTKVSLLILQNSRWIQCLNQTISQWFAMTVTYILLINW